jgi:cyanophycin synthetase
MQQTRQTRETSTNLTDGLTVQAALRPDATAVHLPARIVTFSQLEDLVWRAAMFLNRHSVTAGDVVAITCSNELAILVATLATARIGATTFSVPIGTPSIQRAEVVGAVKAQFLVTDLLDLESNGLPRLPFDLDRIATETTAINVAVRDEYPQAPWLIITGSGSTGRAKLIESTHAMFHAREHLYRDQFAPSQNDCVAVLMHSDFSSAKHLQLNAMFSGAAICLFDRSKTNPIDLCRRLNVTILHTVVIQLEQLIHRLPPEATNVLGSLRALVPLGSAVNDDLRKRVIRTLSPYLYVRYGTNETGQVTIANPHRILSFPGAVGRPASGVQIEVVDASGKILPDGDAGQVRIRSPGMTDHYVDDDQATKYAFKDGWFYPGDLGKFAPDGQLVYLGRADQMMIMDGINIYPAEIEAVVSRHPAVCEAVAIPLHSTLHQHIPVCAVALHSGASVTEQELLDFAFQRLGSRHPRRIIIFEKLPRSPQGKLLLRQLNEEMAERLQSPI